MATIDIRATVTCSLGPLISGNINDDYIQNSGLVKTRGQCELVGVHTPAVGTPVTFAYTQDGTTTQVPRTLRVLSSFADPFRLITKVELGCKLTYLENVTPAPTVDGEAAITSGRQQQCLNGYVEYPANSNVPIPVKASGLLDTCLTKLGLTASSNPLTNVFNVDTFDLSSGYVNVLSDLLLSEGYFGYLDSDEVLQIRDLTTESGTGPALSGNDIIDIDAIGVGDLPGEAVVVRYNSLKLKTDLTTSYTLNFQQNNWEYEETVGDPQTVEIRYSSTLGSGLVATHSYIPYSKTTTTYGTDNSWNDYSCVIASSALEGADLSNSVITRETKQRTMLGECANSYCAQLLSAGLISRADVIGDITTKEEYEYDNSGQVTKQTTYTYEPQFKWAGGLGLDFVYGQQSISLGTADVLVEKVVNTYENIYAPLPTRTYLQPGETLEPVVSGQKITTATYRNWALTLGGQQGSASIKDIAPFLVPTECVDWLQVASKVLVLVDTQVRTQRNRTTIAGQVRPSQSLRIGQANGTSLETTSELVYALGSASSERFISFSMPYQSDDTYSAGGAIVKGDASAKALRFGRIQNRLLLGNRSGVNLQLHPAFAPPAPFDPLYLSNDSLMVQYRANALSWAFSSEGVVASMDALYWGVAGGAGPAWVPVAPGVTTFPPLPTITPPAVEGGAATTTVSSLVLPWVETIPLTGYTSTTATATDYTYVIGLLDTTALTPITRTIAQVPTTLACQPGAISMGGVTATLRSTRRIGGSASSYTLSGQSTTRIRTYGTTSTPTSFALTGKAANTGYNRSPLSTSPATYTLTGNAANFIKGTSFPCATGTFTLSGITTNRIKQYALSASPATFTLSSPDTSLSYTSPAFAYVTYTGNAAARSITNVGFTPALIWINNQSASATLDPTVFDQLQGTGKYWYLKDYHTAYTDAQTVTAFNSNGFSLGTSTATNDSSATYRNYEAYCWKGVSGSSTNTSGTISTTVNTSSAAGLSMFRYTSTGVAGATVGHGLATAPDFVMLRQLTGGAEEAFANSPLLGGAYSWSMNSSAAASSNTGYIRSIGSTTVTLGASLNTSSRTYIGYAFQSITGVSKIGITTGNGSGTMSINVGFMPRFLLVKTYIGTGNWIVYRPTSGATGYATYITIDARIAPTLSSSTQITSTGFSINSGGVGNVTGSTSSILYMAYA